MKNCIDCKNHKIISDPDPYDYFCTDDVAVICTATLNENIKRDTLYMADRSENKPVAVSCRPHHTRQESITPKWCPLITNSVF